MSSSGDDNQSVVWVVLIGVIVLVVASVLGVGVHKSQKASAPVMAAESADGASVQVENGVVKFYFASAKADLAAGAGEALAGAVKAVAEGKTLVLSGFHDATGDMDKNAELAKQRALAVRDALKALGVSDDKLELKKPEAMTGSGSNAQARRVEVSVR